MPLTGQSFLGGSRTQHAAPAFTAFNPATGQPLEPAYYEATPDDVDRAAELAASAAGVFANTSAVERGRFLRAIADGLDARRDEIVERAHLETALPHPRLIGETGRTTGQLRLFAAVVEAGSWVQARIDPPLPDRKPLPRPDLRSMLRPLGPVAVFGASNFPLAFSVAGGDTASALAAGCPVVVKAHPAHPGTSELVAEVIQQVVAAHQLPEGVFSMLFGAGPETGTQLVRHPAIQAVAFTGSLRGGRALMDLAAARPQPIPCFTEMSSGNPLFVLDSILADGGEKFAQGLFTSFTLGAGQMCTKPGIVFVPEGDAAESLLASLSALVSQAQPFSLLTGSIAREYARGTEERAHETVPAATAEAQSAPGYAANARLFVTSLAEFFAHPSFADEIFGPDTLLVRCPSTADYLPAARALDGHLTAAVFGNNSELAANRPLVETLETKAGRVILNGFPTGVEVSHAMVHGGPYPSTSDPRFTSVGTLAIDRFARPVCFQGFPDELLPDELKNGNPLGIERLIDGVLTREAIG